MNITDQLRALCDTDAHKLAEFQQFQAKIIKIPAELFIGVRNPDVRSLAKRIAGTNEALAFMQQLPHSYHEENMLHDYLICCSKDYSNVVNELERWVPYIDNWAVCDSLSPKIIKRHTNEFIKHIDNWLQSAHTYSVRFGIVMLMDFYLDSPVFKPEYLQRVTSVTNSEFYVQMAQAWYFATALAKQWDTTLPIITSKKLPVWVHNKSIQKAVESYRITPEQKELLKLLKIK